MPEKYTTVPKGWEFIVNAVTGYPVPDRARILETAGENGTPWVDIGIKEHNAKQAAHSGPNVDGHDYVIECYSGSGDGAKYNAGGIKGYTVSFNFMWGAGSPDLKNFGDSAQGTGQSYLGQFNGGASDALAALVTKYSTRGLASNGLTVPEADAVDLISLETVAQAFGRAAGFHERGLATLRQWSRSLGDEDASWKGRGAGAFKQLVDGLVDVFDQLTKELTPAGFRGRYASVTTGAGSTTVHGDALLEVQNVVHAAAKDLHLAWGTWRSDGGTVQGTNVLGVAGPVQGRWSPVDALGDLLTEINNHIDTVNRTKVWTTQTGKAQHLSTSGEYRETLRPWGNVRDLGTWQNVVKEALARWSGFVAATLDVPAARQVTAVGDVLNRAMNAQWDPAFTVTMPRIAPLTVAPPTGGSDPDGDGGPGGDTPDTPDTLDTPDVADTTDPLNTPTLTNPLDKPDGAGITSPSPTNPSLTNPVNRPDVTDPLKTPTLTNPFDGSGPTNPLSPSNPLSPLNPADPLDLTNPFEPTTFDRWDPTLSTADDPFDDYDGWRLDPDVSLDGYSPSNSSYAANSPTGSGISGGSVLGGTGSGSNMFAAGGGTGSGSPLAVTNAITGTGIGTVAAASGTRGLAGVPMMPPMAGMGAGAGGRGEEDRERGTWLEEDPDVWGTDPNAPPAVIGRAPHGG